MSRRVEGSKESGFSNLARIAQLLMGLMYRGAEMRKREVREREGEGKVSKRDTWILRHA